MARTSKIFIISIFIACASLFSIESHAQFIKLDSVVVKPKVPKKLRTHTPFWGTPTRISAPEEAYSTTELFCISTDSLKLFPLRWICWNLDLAEQGTDRYRHERYMPKDVSEAFTIQMRRAVNEAYKWAWRKPYGNTCVVVGAISRSAKDPIPSAYYVTVCKEERVKGPLPLGYTSIAFIIPLTISAEASLSDCACSVNAVEYLSGYDLYHKIPKAVQEQVEEITFFELLCPFQEYEESMLDYLTVEIEQGEYTDAPVYE